MFESESAVYGVFGVVFIFKENEKFILEVKDALFGDVEVGPIRFDVRLAHIRRQGTNPNALQHHCYM